ncbi:MAG: flavodoxin [Flavobacteriaceae bacterium]|jgi:flavodoxin I|nr:flavodoxin [Flavobacteriaceae bacterium]|tara:strand:- start:57 stop:572 length:516 start_codon:yes stop_codon:yes gene_type:complete
MINGNFGLIYSSYTGLTFDIATTIDKQLDVLNLEVLEVSSINSSDFLRFDFLILGVPTWFVGELEPDWDDYFPDFEKIDFTGKDIAIFGLGDQYGYPDNFVDGIGILAEVIIKNGGNIIGYWPNKGYDFNKSIGLAPNGMFYGLALDEDNEPELTDERIKYWIEGLLKFLK